MRPAAAAPQPRQRVAPSQPAAPQVPPPAAAAVSQEALRRCCTDISGWQGQSVHTWAINLAGIHPWARRVLEFRVACDAVQGDRLDRSAAGTSSGSQPPSIFKPPKSREELRKVRTHPTVQPLVLLLPVLAFRHQGCSPVVLRKLLLRPLPVILCFYVRGVIFARDLLLHRLAGEGSSSRRCAAICTHPAGSAGGAAGEEAACRLGAGSRRSSKSVGSPCSSSCPCCAQAARDATVGASCCGSLNAQGDFSRRVCS